MSAATGRSMTSGRLPHVPVISGTLMQRLCILLAGAALVMLLASALVGFMDARRLDEKQRLDQAAQVSSCISTAHHCVGSVVSGRPCCGSELSCLLNSL
jgi:sensor domain CHASE-containing protein